MRATRRAQPRGVKRQGAECIERSRCRVERISGTDHCGSQRNLEAMQREVQPFDFNRSDDASRRSPLLGTRRRLLLHDGEGKAYASSASLRTALAARFVKGMSI